KNGRVVVNLTTGSGTMIHEWTHALHAADRAGLSQKHPMWIIEGFGALYEHSEMGPEGSVLGRMNHRLTALTEVLTKFPKMYIPWKTLMQPGTRLFYQPQTVGTAYAEARNIFYYLQQMNKLKAFYAKYREGHAKDATGRKALEAVLGKPIGKIEAEWKRWILKRRYYWAGILGLNAKVDLGMSLAEDERGVTVAGFEIASCAALAGIRRNDVIVSAGGKAIEKVVDLIDLVSTKEPGDKVKIKVRRGGTEMEFEVTLKGRS
ncbi:MAG: PDZ domain-containing protein, partial [Planctomycetota bacterium]